MSAAIDTLSQPLEHIERDDIEFHPLVRAELNLELNKWTNALEKVPPEKLQSVQGKVEILRWLLTKMHGEILQKEREKAKKAEARE